MPAQNAAEMYLPHFVVKQKLTMMINRYEVSESDAAGNPIPGQSSGLSAATEFKIRSSPNGWSDTNGDGYIDGNDDADGDGISNALEELYKTDPTLADTDGDGRSDGFDDPEAEEEEDE